ncbi:MAG: FG-GAP-like repeat-containing protein, partial [Chthoniobacteraceae bacterium]
TELPIDKHPDGTVTIKPEAEIYYAVWRFDYDNWGTESIGTPDRLYHNEGNGPDGVPRFKDVSKAAGISGRGDGLSVTVWDFNGDGKPDIYVGNDFIATDKLYRNNGDGTFTDVAPEMIPYTSWFSMGADFGDLDNDGLPDFMVGDMSVTTHYKAATTMGVLGGMDLRRATSGRPSQHMQNIVLLNTGEGHFREAARLLGLSSTDWTWAVKFADLDNDGWLDIYCTNGISRHMNDADKVITMEMLRGKHMFDFFKEGPMRKEMNRAFRNTGASKFDDVSAAWGLDHVGVTYGAAYADLDRDGDLDLVTVNLEEPNFIYRNDSQTGQRVLIKLVGNGTNKFAFGATLTIRTASGSQTRQLEPQTGYLSCNEPLIHFGLGKDTVIEDLTIRWPAAGEQKLKGLKAGMFYTITQPANGGDPVTPPAPITPMFAKSDVLSTLKNKDAGRDAEFKKQPLLPFALSQLGPVLAWGDVNGDGLDDFYIGGSAGEIAEMRVNNGSGKYVAKWEDAFRADKDCEDAGAVFFDADGDGDLDLFVASGSNEFDAQAKSSRSRLYLNDGKGTFKLAPAEALPEWLEFASAVCVADYDRDGKPDIFVGARTVPGEWPKVGKSLLLHNESSAGAVKFSAQTSAVEGLENAGLVTAAVWSDGNGDGWPDLLVATEWGPVKLFQNEKGKLADRTKQAGLAPVTGWWRGLTAVDVDHDGDQDFVATNLGLNTKYPQATAARPQWMYHGDFGGGGGAKILEVEREGDKLYPDRSLIAWIGNLPTLKVNFPTHAAWGKATLEEIFTPEKLANATRYEAVEFQNGVFVNDGGKFTFRPLERIAQIAPGNSPVVCDFNGDGHADLFLSQNSNATIPEIPRFAGGLGQLLLGDGKGGFRAVPVCEAGIAVPGDAKSASFADLNGDGKPDFVVTVNNGATAAFLNQSTAKWLRVNVPAASAAGTRLTLKRGKLPSQTIEIHAGAGYLAQDSGTAFFGLGEKDAPGSITAVWPDGTTSETAYDGKAAALKIAPQKP